MKISPMRSLFLMWLLCSAWMLLVWWLGHHAAASLSAGPSLPAKVAATCSLAGIALWGGMVLTLFLALYLALAIKIDLGRLRLATRDLARGASAALPDMAPEWLGLLDDVRNAARRQQQELAISRQELDDCEQRLLAEQARAAAAQASAESAALRLRQAQADVRRGLAAMPVVPDAVQETRHERLRILLQPALARLAQGLENLDSTLQPLSDLLDAAAAKPAAQAAAAAQSGPESRPEANALRLVDEAGRLAESLQLLCLNFRLALERLGPELGEDHPELDTVIQDLDPMCADAMALQEAARSAQDAIANRTDAPKASTAPSSWPLSGDETRRILAEVRQAARDEMQALAEALRQGRQGLELAQGEPDRTQGAGEPQARALLEGLDLALKQALDGLALDGSRQGGQGRTGGQG